MKRNRIMTIRDHTKIAGRIIRIGGDEEDVFHFSAIGAGPDGKAIFSMNCTRPCTPWAPTISSPIRERMKRALANVSRRLRPCCQTFNASGQNDAAKEHDED